MNQDFEMLLTVKLFTNFRMILILNRTFREGPIFLYFITDNQIIPFVKIVFEAESHFGNVNNV